MQAVRITAIRHGETDWNAASRVQGHTNIALNARGLLQAERAAAALAQGDAPQCVYSSDLQRAMQTAQAVADATGAPLHAVPGLRERCFGRFEGHSFQELNERFPEEAEQWRRRVPEWAPPGGGESLLAFRARILDAVNTLAAAHLGQHIVIVSHGGALDVLYRAATGLGLQDARTWRLGNAALNRLLWTPESGLTLVGWADEAHLENAPLHGDI
ncbi:MAG: histidine phosphatase family protein [Ottowia sp.]|nr:histidine phosphatase family protein [Ottowia sp.]